MASTLWFCLYIGWIVLEIVVAIATRTRGEAGKVQDRGSQVILWIVICFSITACEWTRRILAHNMFGGAHWLLPVSVVLLAIALAVRCAAIINLGKSFSANVAIRDSQQVYRHGMYRFLRHPSYFGLLLVFLAVGVHSRNWISFAFALVPTTGALLYRIRIEEMALNAAFGEEYAAYSRVTKRLVPGLY